jgi:hypothetical protein
MFRAKPRASKLLSEKGQYEEMQNYKERVRDAKSVIMSFIPP